MPKNDDPDIERLKDELRRVREIVRPRRIEQIIRDDCRGSRKTFAERIGKTESYISRMQPDSAGNKSIGEETAYIIEQRFRKPRGWLDEETRDGVREPTKVTPLLTEDATALALAWQSLSEPIRTHIRLLVDMLATTPAKKKRRSFVRALSKVPAEKKIATQ